MSDAVYHLRVCGHFEAVIFDRAAATHINLASNECRFDLQIWLAFAKISAK